MSHLHLEQINSTLSETLDKTDGIHTSVKPSAKALGKRKVTDTEEPEGASIFVLSLSVRLRTP